ncbi:MAG: 6-phosphogluconolactonase [Anaerolineales bacterium]
MTSAKQDLRIYQNPFRLAEAAADFFVRKAIRAINEQGFFSVLLAGGSTPREIYRHLAESSLLGRGFWKNIYLFWGDERCVPPDDSNSNYLMVLQSLLERVPIPSENVFRIRGELDPQIAADRYEQDIRNSFAQKGSGVGDQPAFDLILLGMGTDGHTASLFPGSAALNETTKLVVAVEHIHPPPPLVPRVTATPVLINAGLQIVFLVTGKEKSERLEQVLSGPNHPGQLPAQIVRPYNGHVTWFVDQPAASRLSKEDQS